jgi:hypothetical protein
MKWLSSWTGRHCEKCGEMDMVSAMPLHGDKKLTGETCPMCASPLSSLPDKRLLTHRAMIVAKYVLMASSLLSALALITHIAARKASSRLLRASNSLETLYKNDYHPSTDEEYEIEHGSINVIAFESRAQEQAARDWRKANKLWFLAGRLRDKSYPFFWLLLVLGLVAQGVLLAGRAVIRKNQQARLSE